MATHADDEGRGPTGRANCVECGAHFDGSQRYCLQCGARRGDLPADVAAGIVASRTKDRAGGAVAGVAATPGGAPKGAPRSVSPTPSWMPSRQAAAIAVLTMLGLGIVLGSATSQFADSKPLSTLFLPSPHKPAPAPAPEEPEEEETEAIAEAPTTEPEPEPEAEPEEVVEEAPVPEEIIEETPLPEEETEAVPPPVPFDPLEEAENEEPELVEPPVEEGLPEVKHAFVVVLGDNGYEELFGKSSPSKYLRKELPKKGELLPNYYAVATGSLANQIALISGQGPTPETAANCPTYAPIVPGTVSAEGQVEGNGCVYPKEVETLPNQLTAAGDTWRAYVEDIDHGAEIGQPASCRRPVLGGPDTSPLPLPGDAYETWRNPFVFFDSIVEEPKEECEKNDVGLEALVNDLKAPKKTPTLSYIVPNACHAGGEVPCAEGQPTGALAVEAFLRKLVPAIMSSAAYREGGLIAITSAQAPQTGEHADASACCAVPEFPNLPPVPAPAAAGAVKASGGGGQVGMLLISPFIEPGTVEETGYYNHFTFLLTLEELFGLEKLGYAAEPALLPFESGESAVFNVAAEEPAAEEEAKPKRPQSTAALRRLLRWASRSRSAAPSAAPAQGR